MEIGKKIGRKMDGIKTEMNVCGMVRTRDK